MTVNEIAEVLRVHRAAVYRMMAEGRLPYKQVSLRTRRVRTSAVKKLLDSMSLRWCASVVHVPALLRQALAGSQRVPRRTPGR